MVSILFLLMVVGFFYLPADPNKIDVLKELLPPSVKIYWEQISWAEIFCPALW